MDDIEKVVNQFIDEALSEFNSGKTTVSSRHVDELMTYSTIAPMTLTLSIDLFRVLLKLYDKYSTDMMALLVLQITDSEKIEYHALSELLDGKLDINAPPSLYLIKRLKDTEPYVIEEYKRPISQKIISSDEGCIYAYFRAFKNQPDDAYEQGFYFEHYPQSGPTYNWA